MEKSLIPKGVFPLRKEQAQARIPPFLPQNQAVEGIFPARRGALWTCPPFCTQFVDKIVSKGGQTMPSPCFQWKISTCNKKWQGRQAGSSVNTRKTFAQLLWTTLCARQGRNWQVFDSTGNIYVCAIFAHPDMLALAQSSPHFLWITL